jgi:hypothetical protein
MTTGRVSIGALTASLRQNYTVRNAVVSMMGALLLAAFRHERQSASRMATASAAAHAEHADSAVADTAAAADADDSAAALLSSGTRDSLLKLLLERFRDVHAYTRARVLQAWIQLASCVTPAPL